MPEPEAFFTVSGNSDGAELEEIEDELNESVAEESESAAAEMGAFTELDEDSALEISVADEIFCFFTGSGASRVEQETKIRAKNRAKIFMSHSSWREK